MKQSCDVPKTDCLDVCNLITGITREPWDEVPITLLAYAGYYRRQDSNVLNNSKHTSYNYYNTIFFFYIVYGIFNKAVNRKVIVDNVLVASFTTTGHQKQMFLKINNSSRGHEAIMWWPQILNVLLQTQNQIFARSGHFSHILSHLLILWLAQSLLTVRAWSRRSPVYYHTSTLA